MTDVPFRCGAAILAAGASSRMGRAKTLLPWGSRTVISHLVGVYRDLTEPVVIVCRPDDFPLHTELDALGFPATNRIANPDAASGMYSSVRLALQWPGWRDRTTHVLLGLVDQPQILPVSISRLLDAARRRPDRIIQPLHQGRCRHPVLLPLTLAAPLADPKRYQTLREALEDHQEQVFALQLDDPGLSTDFDTPAQYEEAVKRFSPNQP